MHTDRPSVWVSNFSPKRSVFGGFLRAKISDPWRIQVETIWIIQNSCYQFLVWMPYCWWKKSCKKLKSLSRFICPNVPGGAGFLPSTVWTGIDWVLCMFFFSNKWFLFTAQFILSFSKWKLCQNGDLPWPPYSSPKVLGCVIRLQYKTSMYGICMFISLHLFEKHWINHL